MTKVGDYLYYIPTGKKCEITGESKTHWETDFNPAGFNTVSKQSIREDTNEYFTSDPVKALKCAISYSRWEIGTLVKSVTDPDILRQIAALIGYELPRID